MCRLEKEVLGIITNAEYKNMEGRFLTQKNHTESNVLLNSKNYKWYDLEI